MGGAARAYKYLHEDNSSGDDENSLFYDDNKIDYKYLEKKKSIVHPDAREMLNEGALTLNNAKILQDILNPIPNDIYWQRICTYLGNEKPHYKLPGKVEIPTYVEIWENLMGRRMQYITDKEKKNVFPTYLIDETDSLEIKKEKHEKLISRVISELRLILSKYKKYDRKPGEKGPIDNFNSLRNMFPKYLYAGKTGKKLHEAPYFSSALGKLLPKLKYLNEPYVDPNAASVNKQTIPNAAESIVRPDEKKYATPYIQNVTHQVAHTIQQNNGIFPTRPETEKTNEPADRVIEVKGTGEDKKLNEEDIARVYSKDEEGNEPWHNRI